MVTPTETIAFADGEKQIFNYTVKNPPVLGEIKISGGGYSWTEAVRRMHQVHGNRQQEQRGGVSDLPG